MAICQVLLLFNVSNTITKLVSIIFDYIHIIINYKNECQTGKLEIPKMSFIMYYTHYS